MVVEYMVASKLSSIGSCPCSLAVQDSFWGRMSVCGLEAAEAMQLLSLHFCNTGSPC